MLIWSRAPGGDWPQSRIGGALYDPDADLWQPIARPLGPDEAQYEAVWVGDEMVTWGIANGSVDAAAYAPGTGTWRSIAPGPLSARYGAAVVASDQGLLVWGGVDAASGQSLDDGAYLNPASDTWVRTSDAPLSGRADVAAVWTGASFLLWGGQRDSTGPLGDGAAYDPASDRWELLPVGPLNGGLTGTFIWTGEQLVVWGGLACGPRIDQPACFTAVSGAGAIYDPTSGSWRLMAPGPLSPRSGQVSAWTGNDVIIWGGQGSLGDKPSLLSDGARYDPSSGVWLSFEP